MIVTRPRDDVNKEKKNECRGIYSCSDDAIVTGRIETEDGTYINLELVEVLESKTSNKVRLVFMESKEDKKLCQ